MDSDQGAFRDAAHQRPGSTVTSGRKKTRYTYFVGLLRSLGIFDTQAGKASFHSIRASFITRCDEAGINRRATKGVAGQVADNITDLYSHDKETAKEILTLPPLPLP